ncbi:hypothetical protein CDAR_193871 [Caerostris darwini]|uniref:Uncharacterized protein n=1 Tax=Caerostris darwini TaxID=1538125 RepID=A0AAV4VQ42_9ARAC|nr:hypothetical protein CDAR_193871 [Caerostris darwini]
MAIHVQCVLYGQYGNTIHIGMYGNALYIGMYGNALYIGMYGNTLHIGMYGNTLHIDALAFRRCDAQGQWADGGWTNYSECEKLDFQVSKWSP